MLDAGDWMLATQIKFRVLGLKSFHRYQVVVVIILLMLNQFTTTMTTQKP